MGLLSNELEKLRGKRIALVLVDGVRLKGKVTDFDDRTIILNDVTELVDNRWVRPLISRSLGTDLNYPHPSTPSDTDPNGKDTAVLVKVIVHTRHVVRIWPWEPRALPPREPVESVNKV